MTLREQIADDMPVFFNTDEFAEAATYTPSGGSPASINVILSGEDHDREDTGTGKKKRRTARLMVKRTDVASPGHGDTVTINSESWAVIDILSQDDYTATLHIERVETIERSVPGYRIQ